MPPSVVAQIGARCITAEQWQAALDRLGPGATAEQRQALLDELIRGEVLLAQARQAGYHQKSDLQARYDQLVCAAYKEEKLQPVLSAAATVTDDEIVAYYEAHSSKYTSPEAFRIGVICLKLTPKVSTERRDEAVQRAKMILAEARQTNEAGFARLTQQYSEDQATRYRGGDAGWISAGGTNAHWPAAVVETASTLVAPGDFASVVETESGLYIARLLEKRSASRRPLEEVREGIRYLITREKQEQAERHFYEQLSAGVPININRGLLESVSVRSNSVSSRPPRLPGG